MSDIIQELVKSPEPSVRFKVRVGGLGEDRNSPAIRRLRRQIKKSERVSTLLHNRDRRGRIRPVKTPYTKWTGAHWVFATLADIGYPSRDRDLIPVRDQVFDCWLRPEAIREHICGDVRPRNPRRGVPVVRGRARRCASQQGNALFAAVTLNLMDGRCQQLAECLLRWQWPDGGWNCDRKPEAATSSFWESLIPLRALSAYAKATGDAGAQDAANRAAEVFLTRRLFLRRTTGDVMNPQFVRLHYPCYWRYDILFGLKVMAECGFVSDPRCSDALDLLESKRLPDGGWPAEERFYRMSQARGSGCERVSWRGVSKKRMNEWVTADALYVLSAAGRLDPTERR